MPHRLRDSCLFLILASILQASPARAGDLLKRDPVVPSPLAFARMFDVEGYVQRVENHGRGAQTLRLRTRYLDPDVNAFVGFVTGLSHFNQDLYLGDPDSPDTAVLLSNWGIDVGLKRNKHLWELDVMGVVAGVRFGPAIAFVGEHNLTRTLLFYHRTEVNLLGSDAILDADQGLYKMFGWFGLQVGYRAFGSSHMNRGGPHIGFRLLFDSPKIPFIFPSLG